MAAAAWHVCSCLAGVVLLLSGASFAVRVVSTTASKVSSRVAHAVTADHGVVILIELKTGYWHTSEITGQLCP
jgi:hypothetical protein